MMCDSPEQRFMHVLQALALPAEAQREYLPVDRKPSLLFDDYRHLLGILQGRDDWRPTCEQQETIERLFASMGEVNEPEVSIAASEWLDVYTGKYTDTIIRLAREALDNAEWQTLREKSRDTLSAFGWEHVAPPESVFHAYARLENSRVNELDHLEFVIVQT